MDSFMILDGAGTVVTPFVVTWSEGQDLIHQGEIRSIELACCDVWKFYPDRMRIDLVQAAIRKDIKQH